MDTDDIVTLVFFAIFFIAPVFMSLFRKKKGSLPKTKEDFEKRYQVKTQEATRREHLKPPLVQPPELKRQKEPSSPKVLKDEVQFLSGSYSSDYSLKSEITERGLDSDVSTRHIESSLETLGFSDLLQDRFSEDIISHAKKSSYGKNLLTKASLREVVILSEILKRPYLDK